MATLAYRDILQTQTQNTNQQFLKKGKHVPVLATVSQMAPEDMEKMPKDKSSKDILNAIMGIRSEVPNYITSVLKKPR